MLSTLLVEPFHLEVVERPDAELGPTDILVEVTACGICASDVDAWQGRSERELPVLLGHEPAGIVAETGRDVEGLTPGTRVAAWVEEGGFSERLVVDQRHCLPVADDCAHPVVAEPLACVVNAVELAAPRLGDNVVIVGAGFMGNLLQLVAQLRGPATVTVVDIRADALERAARLGATHTLDPSACDVGDVVRELVDRRGADLTFEVTGTNGGLDLATAATRMSGKLCIVGYHQGGGRQIPLGYWNWMAFELVNAHFREVDRILAGMRAGLRLLGAGALDVAPLITNAYPLQRIEEAFGAAHAKPDGFVKAVVTPNGGPH